MTNEMFKVWHKWVSGHPLTWICTTDCSRWCCSNHVLLEILSWKYHEWRYHVANSTDRATHRYQLTSFLRRHGRNLIGPFVNYYLTGTLYGSKTCIVTVVNVFWTKRMPIVNCFQIVEKLVSPISQLQRHIRSDVEHWSSGFRKRRDKHVPVAGEGYRSSHYSSVNSKELVRPVELWKIRSFQVEKRWLQTESGRITQDRVAACRSGDRNSQAEALNRPRSTTRRSNYAVESDKYLAKMVTMKLEEGNLEAAVRLICSEDRPAPYVGDWQTTR